MAEMMEGEGGGGSGSSSSSGDRRYKGVRQRKWGSWVSEIRLPNSRKRIWLGSYDSPEKAARAFDAAAVCLRGRRRSQLNCPDTPPPRVAAAAAAAAACPLTIQQIQAAAARHAASDSPATPRPATGSPSEDGSFAARGEEALDWSFLDAPPRDAPPEERRFSDAMDDFMFDYFSPVPTAADTPEEHDVVEFGTDSSLWSF